MPKKHANKHTKAAELRETSGADTSHERMKAQPAAKDLKDPKEVWKDAETTPARDRAREAAPGGGAKRVADAGDVGAGETAPYDTEVQADAVARQTHRTEEPRDVEKPKRS